MFRCSHCDKSYQRKAHLQRHEVTHTGQAASACPFCQKTFLKPEVARRHSKKCAIVHNQQPVPAARPGRKRQSCDQCFSLKRACDLNTPCSRCHSTGTACTFELQPLPLGASSPADLPLSPAIQSPSSRTTDSQFSFLRHFTDPCVEKDRLAIGTTAESSVRRNLETLYSHLEDALIPLDSMAGWLDGLSPAGSFFQPSLITDDIIPADFLIYGPTPTKLSGQLDELMLELVETSKSMKPDELENTQTLPEASHLASVLTVSSIGTFISVFFHSLYWHLPVVHFPTFDPGNISNPLLLSVFLAGATYSGTFNEAALLPGILDVAEEYIFRKVTALSSQTAVTTNELTRHEPTIQLIQAALIMEMLQFGQEKLETRRRIRIIRHPSLVSLMRCLGMFQLKRPVPPTLGDSDDIKWREMVAEEVCIRLASWVFLADGFLTLCFKNRPTLSVFELDCSFPWRTELWEAENVSIFNRIFKEHGTEIPLPSIRDAIQLLLENPGAGPVSSRPSLSAEHLLIMIYALNSLAFMARVDFFTVPLEKIKCAANNWKQIWDLVSANNERKLHLGYPKHAEELWLLLTATLDLAKLGTNHPYLDMTSAATDDLGKLNEFIKWCTRYRRGPMR
ncbi:hypothetical protein BJY04DRAFT_207381 [Aspergillus karnatakaensis]|uniref:Zn(II)2Cys6 transcription factor n=1 Tax=Aspergillus karnatakaensis TaxID=1810916 RepID=UPI003CCCD8B3